MSDKEQFIKMCDGWILELLKDMDCELSYIYPEPPITNPKEPYYDYPKSEIKVPDLEQLFDLIEGIQENQKYRFEPCPTDKYRWDIYINDNMFWSRYRKSTVIQALAWAKFSLVWDIKTATWIKEMKEGVRQTKK